MGEAVADDEPSDIKAPDGGWSWVILFGCFVITGFSYAFPKALSVFFHELIAEFEIGYSDTAWISSIILAMLYGTGPLVGIYVNWFGCRPVMMAGGLLSCAGMVAASFCTSIITIYICAGIITGFGLALSFQPALIVLNRYFNNRRPLANGLAAAGSPVFPLVLSPLGQALLDTYGWRGSFLIMAGLIFNCTACGALMRPLVTSKKTIVEQAKADIDKNTEKSPRKKLIDANVCKHKGFVIYTLAVTIMALGLFVPPVFVVNFGKDIGVPDTMASYLLTILGCIDIFTRLTFGIITGLPRIRPYAPYIFGFAMLFNGITDLMGSMSNSFGGLVIFCVFFGISNGMIGALQFEVLMTVVGTKRFSSALGLVLLAEACAVLIGPPSAGRIWDGTGKYLFVLIFAGSEVVLSSLVFTTGNIFCMRKKELDCNEKNAENGECRKTEDHMKAMLFYTLQMKIVTTDVKETDQNENIKTEELEIKKSERNVKVNTSEGKIKEIQKLILQKLRRARRNKSKISLNHM